MFFPVLQFAVGPSSPVAVSLDNTALFWLLLVVATLASITSGLFLLRSLLRSRHHRLGQGSRLVLQIMVPKEKKSEGHGGQVAQDDRLEQIREEIAITESFFAAIAGLKPDHGIHAWLVGRKDHLACEVVMHNGLISFYVEMPRRFHHIVEQYIHAQYPYAEITEIADYNMFTEKSSIVGAYLVGQEHHFSPIKTYKTFESDPAGPVLNALSKIREHNSSAAVQFVVRPAGKHWRKEGAAFINDAKRGKKTHSAGKQVLAGVGSFASLAIEQIAATAPHDKEKSGKEEHKELTAVEEQTVKLLQEKIGKGGLEVTIRLLSSSDSSEIAKEHLETMISAFSIYNLYQYGNTFTALIPRKQSTLIRDFIYRNFTEKRSLILNTEEMAGLWHLPLHSTEAPNIKWLGARRSAPPSNLPTSGLLLGHIEYRGLDVPVHMKDVDRRRHMYIIGKSGSGKSIYMANLAIQDIKSGHGVCVVDPHGDLVEDILQHIPKDRADDVIIFNPSDVERPIGLNMLEAKTEDQKDFAVQEMISIFYKLFPPEMMGPIFEHNMRNVMLTLMADINNSGTIIDIPRMFTDDSYVKQYLKKLKDPVVRAFWEKEMAKTSDHTKGEMLGYLISKVGRFVENEMMRNIMGQQQSGFNFRDIMDKQKIFLVNLAKGRTGEVNSKLIGLIVVAKLQMAAMSRADLPAEERKDFYLYIDEFQNFVTDSIATILSEARKYKLNLIVAHQYMSQLVDEKGKGEIRDAVLGNVGTMNIFRIGPEDADLLAKEFVPTFGSYDLLNVPQYSCYTKMLIDNTASKPFNMLTYPLPAGNKQLGEAIKELSRLKYGRDRRLVEAEILERTQTPSAPVRGGDSFGDPLGL